MHTQTLKASSPATYPHSTKCSFASEHDMHTQTLSKLDKHVNSNLSLAYYLKCQAILCDIRSFRYFPLNTHPDIFTRLDFKPVHECPYTALHDYAWVDFMDSSQIFGHEKLMRRLQHVHAAGVNGIYMRCVFRQRCILNHGKYGIIIIVIVRAGQVSCVLTCLQQRFHDDHRMHYGRNHFLVAYHSKVY
jgi:hypothetical protein